MPRLVHLVRIPVALTWLATLVAPAAGAGQGFETAVPVAVGTPPATSPGPAPGPSPGPSMGSEFTVRSPLLADDLLSDGLLAARGMTREPKKPKPPKEPGAVDSTAAAPATQAAAPAAGGEGSGLPGALSGDRARVMLQSLTVPGWGQATLGQSRAALAFGLVETGIWVSFAAFQVQETMRRHTYEGTARLFAGIDLSGRDEEYRHVVGQYRSSADYNVYVVRRDAANLYYGDPAGYDAYVAAHEIKGADAWVWQSDDDLLRYRDERQAAQRSTKHAQDALAAALINRLVSVVLVARSHPKPADQASWRIECAPAPGDLTAYRLAVRADF
jgi:hypothetical protein